MITAIGLVFKAIFSFFAKVFAWLIDHPKILIAIVLAIVCFVGYMKVSHEFALKDKEIATLQAEKKQWLLAEVIYKSNERVQLQINKDNQAVLQTIDITKDFAKKSAVDAKKQNDKTVKQIETLISSIKATPPKDDAPIAPVLKNTIKEIDSNRQERNKLWAK